MPSASMRLFVPILCLGADCRYQECWWLDIGEIDANQRQEKALLILYGLNMG